MSSCTIESSFFSFFFFFFSRYSCYYLVVAYLTVRQKYISTGFPIINGYWCCIQARTRIKRRKRKEENKKIVSVFLGPQIHTHTILLLFVDVFFSVVVVVVICLQYACEKRSEKKRYYFSFFVHVLGDNRACLSFCRMEVLRTKQTEREKKKEFPKQHKSYRRCLRDRAGI